MTIHKKMALYSLIVFVFALIALLTYIWTGNERESLGFLLGLLFGYANLWTVYRKTKIVSAVAAKVWRKPFSVLIAGLGFTVRAAIAITAIWLSLRFPETFHLHWVIIGIAFLYIIILLDVIVQSLRKR